MTIPPLQVLSHIGQKLRLLENELCCLPGAQARGLTLLIDDLYLEPYNRLADLIGALGDGEKTGKSTASDAFYRSSDAFYRSSDAFYRSSEPTADEAKLDERLFFGKPFVSEALRANQAISQRRGSSAALSPSSDAVYRSSDAGYRSSDAGYRSEEAYPASVGMRHDAPDFSTQAGITPRRTDASEALVGDGGQQSRPPETPGGAEERLPGKHLEWESAMPFIAQLPSGFNPGDKTPPKATERHPPPAPQGVRLVRDTDGLQAILGEALAGEASPGKVLQSDAVYRSSDAVYRSEEAIGDTPLPEGEAPPAGAAILSADIPVQSRPFSWASALTEGVLTKVMPTMVPPPTVHRSLSTVHRSPTTHPRVPPAPETSHRNLTGEEVISPETIQPGSAIFERQNQDKVFEQIARDVAQKQLAELLEQLELAFLRAYGTSGG